MLIASLPMYDWPEVRAETDSWWQGLARAFRSEGVADVPDILRRDAADDATWEMDNLLFSQTCGYPYTHGGSNHLRLVATPCFDIDGCDGPNYQSFLLCRKDAVQNTVSDFRGSRAAINDLRSQSGYSALRAVIAPLADGKMFFKQVITSGGHRFSMDMVSQGEVDLCAVDAVCFALAARYVPDMIRPLKIIARSPMAPMLPYVSARQTSGPVMRKMRTGLIKALRDPELDAARQALFLSGAEVLTDADYQRILDIEDTAAKLGYPDVK